MISTVLNLISMGRDWSRVHGMCIRNSLINPLRSRSIKQAHNSKQPSDHVETTGILLGGMLDASLMGNFGCPKAAKVDADFSAFSISYSVVRLQCPLSASQRTEQSERNASCVASV